MSLSNWRLILSLVSSLLNDVLLSSTYCHFLYVLIICHSEQKCNISGLGCQQEQKWEWSCRGKIGVGTESDCQNGMGMWMQSWEWVEMGIVILFPHSCSTQLYSPLINVFVDGALMNACPRVKSLAWWTCVSCPHVPAWDTKFCIDLGLLCRLQFGACIFGEMNSVFFSAAAAELSCKRGVPGALPVHVYSIAVWRWCRHRHEWLGG